MSAIKHIVQTDNYHWEDSRILLSSIVRACKLKNDRQKVRLPIKAAFLEILLFELEHMYATQPYLCILYQSIFAIAYYGLMRIGEIVHSKHTLKAKDMHNGANKNKVLLVLYSSKTHNQGSEPQKIKITEVSSGKQRNFCPFNLLHKYIKLRGSYLNDCEEFFVFRDRSVIHPSVVRTLLRKLIKGLNLQDHLYDCHSFCIGRSSDLFKFGVQVDVIKKMGRWKLNAVYKYLKL